MKEYLAVYETLPDRDNTAGIGTMKRIVFDDEPEPSFLDWQRQHESEFYEGDAHPFKVLVKVRVTKIAEF